MIYEFKKLDEYDMQNNMSPFISIYPGANIIMVLNGDKINFYINNSIICAVFKTSKAAMENMKQIDILLQYNKEDNPERFV